MLAQGRPSRVVEDVWWIEPKLDGWRAMVSVDGDHLSVRTRTGRSITERVPELAPLARALGRPCALDGELIAGAGLPGDFYRLGPRVARRRGHLRPAVGLTFVAFDLLWLDDEPTIGLPYQERRRLLESLDLTGPGWATMTAFDGGSTEVMEACGGLGLEGVVAKRAASPYRPGERSDDWLKVKTTAWKALHGPRRHERA